jgi:hypothetical protein
MEALLAQLDLLKFSSKFKDEDIDLEAAKALSEEEMASLGLTLGARKKLYAALHPGGTSPVATAVPAAAAPPSAPLAVAGPTKDQAFGFQWKNGARKWDSMPYTERVSVQHDANPRFLVAGTRNNEEEQVVIDFSLGQVYAKIPYMKSGQNNGIGRFFDWDIDGDTVLAVGGDGNSVLQISSVSEAKGKHLYVGISEGGFYRGALCKGASGSTQAVAIGSHNGNIKLFDVATGRGCGKMMAYEDEWSNGEMAADLSNPQCFIVSGGSGKLAYCDLRVGKRVKQLMGLDSSISSVSFARGPAGAGKLVVTDSGETRSLKVIDIGQEKILHGRSPQLPRFYNQRYRSAGLYHNILVAYHQPGCDFIFDFFDLATEGDMLGEPFHDLRGPSVSAGVALLFPNPKLVVCVGGNDDFASFGL